MRQNFVWMCRNNCVGVLLPWDNKTFFITFYHPETILNLFYKFINFYYQGTISATVLNLLSTEVEIFPTIRPKNSPHFVIFKLVLHII